MERRDKEVVLALMKESETWTTQERSTDFTLVPGDALTVIELTNVQPIVITVPLDWAAANPTEVQFLALGEGAVSFAYAAGVDLQSPRGFYIDGRPGRVWLRRRGQDAYVMTGDLTSAPTEPPPETVPVQTGKTVRDTVLAAASGMTVVLPDVRVAGTNVSDVLYVGFDTGDVSASLQAGDWTKVSADWTGTVGAAMFVRAWQATETPVAPAITWTGGTRNVTYAILRYLRANATVPVAGFSKTIASSVSSADPSWASVAAVDNGVVSLAVVNDAGATVTPPSFTFTANRTSGSAVLAAVSSFAGLVVGNSVAGTGIPVNATIASLDSVAATVTLSDAATSGSATSTTVTVSYTERTETDAGATTGDPTFRQKSQVTPGSMTSVTPTKPTGFTAGDVHVLALFTTNTSVTFTTTGWTIETAAGVTGAAGRLIVATRVEDGSAFSAITWGGSSIYVNCQVLCYSAVDATDPITASSTASTSSAFPTTSVLDTFNRANGASLGANWTSIYGGSDFSIVSNQAVAAAYSDMRYSAASYGADQEAYVDIVATPATWEVAFYLRETLVGSFYEGYRVMARNNETVIHKNVAGAETYLINTTTAWAAGDKIGVRVIGTTINVFRYTAGAWNQTPVLSTTDSSITTGGNLVLRANLATVDNFGGGTFNGTNITAPSILPQVAGTMAVWVGVTSNAITGPSGWTSRTPGSVDQQPYEKKLTTSAATGDITGTHTAASSVASMFTLRPANIGNPATLGLETSDKASAAGATGTLTGVFVGPNRSYVAYAAALQAASTTTPPPPPPPGDSPNGTTMPPAVEIRSGGKVLTLSGGVVYADGAATISSGVTSVFVYNGAVYQQTAAGFWAWNGTGWGSMLASDPRVVAPPPPPPPPSGGIQLGAAVIEGNLVGTYATVYHTNFRVAVQEWEGKWPSLESSQGAFNFTAMDAWVDDLQANGMKGVWHTPCWYLPTYGIPNWVVALPNNQVQARLETLISTVLGRYKTRNPGVITKVDIANETLNDGASSFRTFKLTDAMGFGAGGVPNYIRVALAAAKAADPTVRPRINDYSVERSGQSTKRNALLAMLNQLRGEGYTNLGAGWQCHFDNVDWPTATAWAALIKPFTDAGFFVDFTECDFSLTGNIDTAQQQLDGWTALADAAKLAGVEWIVQWGLIDSDSWRGDAANALTIESDFSLKASYQKLKSVAGSGPPPVATESADGTTIRPSSGTIVDAQGRSITITPGGVVQRNGVNLGTSSNVVTVVYTAHRPVYTNTTPASFYWDDTANTWVSTGAPVPESPNGTTITPGTGTITDQARRSVTVTAGGVVQRAEPGGAAANLGFSASVVRVVYDLANHRPIQVNSANDSWYWDDGQGTWVAAGAAPSESPDQTVITPGAGTILDSLLRVITLTSGGVVQRDGANLGTTSNVVKVTYDLANHRPIYTDNANASKYWDGAAWQTQATPPPPPPPPPPGTQIIGLNTGGWGLYSQWKADGIGYVRVDWDRDRGGFAAMLAGGTKIATCTFGTGGSMGGIDANSYAQNVRAAVLQYPMVAVEVLNEPYGGWFWSDPTNYTKYVQILQATYNALQGTGVKVLAPFDDYNGWGNGIKNAGALNYCDWAVVHPYGGLNKSTAIDVSKAAINSVRSRTNKPVAITELGWPTGPGATGDSAAWTQAEQAANTTTMMQWVQTITWIPMWTYYNAVDQYGNNSQYGIQGRASGGALGSKKPAYAIVASYAND